MFRTVVLKMPHGVNIISKQPHIYKMKTAMNRNSNVCHLIFDRKVREKVVQLERFFVDDFRVLPNLI